MCDFSGYDLRGDEMGESRPPRIKLVGYKRGECGMCLQGAHTTFLTQYIWGVDARGFLIVMNENACGSSLALVQKQREVLTTTKSNATH